MISSKKVADSFALVFVNNKKELIKLLNKYGASIKDTATNQKVLNVFKGFVTSNKKFEGAYTDLRFRKGYLKETDFHISSNDLNSEHLNMAGMTAGMISQGVGDVFGGIGKMFARPEVNSEGMAGIMALEQEKLKNEGLKIQNQGSNAPYFIAGAAIIGAITILGIIIYKRRK